MKNLNKIAAIFVALTISALILSSCKDDKSTAAPTINNMELGASNSHVGYIGHDLHVEAEVEAEGTISTITVKIYQSENDNVLTDTVFAEFEGLKNATFHKHIAIAANAVAGNYHFCFVVTDKAGKQTTYEADNLKIEYTSSDTPTISFEEVGKNNVAYQGDTLNLDIDIAAPLGVATLQLIIHNEADEDDMIINETYTENFVGQTDVCFQKSIAISSTATIGNYGVHMIVTDAAGTTVMEEAELQIQAAR